MPDPKSPHRPAAINRRQRGAALGLILVFSSFLLGCRPKSAAKNDAAHVVLTFDAGSAAVGINVFKLTVTDAAGQPIRVEHVAVEGDMNHAGMTPAFAQLRETAPGQFAGAIELTMGGDWFLLVTGEIPGGQRLNEKIDLPGVKPK